MIELAKVSLRRGNTMVLDSAYVRVEKSQVVLISGPSGIGKTSLLSLIGGFLNADSGEVRVFQHEVSKMRATSTHLLRRKLAFVPQELELINDQSALSNVRLALEVCGESRKEANQRSQEALEAVDLADCIHRKVSKLSTGQRRRVSLARGMVRNAEIFVADEPSNDLDAERVLQFVDIIESKREEGTSIVMATNDPRLLTHASQPGWRHLALLSGQLVPGEMSSLFEKPNADENDYEETASKQDLGGKIVPFPLYALAGE